MINQTHRDAALAEISATLKILIINKFVIRLSLCLRKMWKTEMMKQIGHYLENMS